MKRILLPVGFELAFPRDGTSRDKPGRDVPLSLCPGTTVFPLSRCPFVPGQGQEQMSRDKVICPGTSGRTKLAEKIPKKGQKCSKPGKDALKQDVPGHLLLPLSRDKGTPGQEFFCPRPVETLILGPNFKLCQVDFLTQFFKKNMIDDKYKNNL